MVIKNKYSIFILLCITILCGCKEEYLYPSVTAEFCDVNTDSKGRLTSILTDDNELLQILDRNGIDGFAKDSTYRCIAQFSVPQSNDSVFLYTLTPVFSHLPTPIKDFLKHNEDGIIQDPVALQSFWAKERYINMILIQKKKEIQHKYELIDEGMLTDQEGHKTARIIIYHNRMGDYEAYNSEVHVSIPLDRYNEIMTEGDRIQVKISTYKNHNAIKTFERRNRKWLLTD